MKKLLSIFAALALIAGSVNAQTVKVSGTVSDNAGPVIGASILVKGTTTVGRTVETIYDADREGKSVCHPKVSPDGRFVCISIADYGTFPLWHREADLLMINLQTGERIPMTEANSSGSESYHSWSSNSRWMVFASKRDDGVYGKPYFCHVDEEGRCSKSFALPQKYTGYYDNLLKSFNAPELGKDALPFTTYDVYEALKGDSVQFE